MSSEFYQILLASLAVTVGIGLLFWGYKYLLAKLNRNEAEPKPYVVLKPASINQEVKMIEVTIMVPEKLDVALNIINGEGKVIKGLCDKELKKGNHKFTWKWDQIPENKLFCQLVTDYQKTEKIVQL